jgi:hypothetical protein
LRQLFHFAQMLTQAVRIIAELGGDLAPDVPQPVESVVFDREWRL